MLELSLKPQSSTKWLSTPNYLFTDFVSDGELFSSVSGYNFLLNTNNADALGDSIALDPATGNWTGYYQTGLTYKSGKPQHAAQSRDAGIVSRSTLGIKFTGIFGSTFGGHSGLYQRIYGLEVGNKYTMTVVIDVPLAGVSLDSEVTIGSLSSNESNMENALTTGENTITLDFFADYNYADVYLDYFSMFSETLTLKSFKVTEHISEVTVEYLDLEDGSVILDLFDDSIPLTLSVSDFTDATSNLQSYSKDFKLPSTKRNDRAFSHIYDLNTSIEDDINAFNPYIKTVATLKEDGIEIFSGLLTLNEISKNDEGIVYDVHLQSNVSGFADSLKGRKFNDIDFSELDHVFNKENVKASWVEGIALDTPITASSKAYTGSLTNTTVLKYPFVDWTGNIGGELDTASTGKVELNRLEDAFRPFINVKYIFDKIVDAAGFTYDSGFMSSEEFGRLYMDFNHGGETGAVIGSQMSKFNLKSDLNPRVIAYNTWTKLNLNNLDTNSAQNKVVAELYWDEPGEFFSPLNDGTTVDFEGKIPLYSRSHQSNSIATQIDCRVLHTKGDGSDSVVLEEQRLTLYNGAFDDYEFYEPNFTVTMDLGDKIYFQANEIINNYNVVETESFTDVDGSNNNEGYTKLKVRGITSEGVTLESILNESRGDVSQWDFVKDLISMHNIIVSPDLERSNHLLIDTYDSVFGLIGYKQLVVDNNFSDPNLFEWTDDSSVDASIDNGLMSISSDGTAANQFESAYSPNIKFIDGNTYNVEFDIKEITNGGEIKLQLYKGGYSAITTTSVTTEGVYKSSFTFNKAANGGHDNLKLRIRMHSGQTLAYSVDVNSISIFGESANIITKKDWSQKVDTETYKIAMMDLNKHVDFKYVKDEEDAISNVYSLSVSNVDGSSYRYGNDRFQVSRLDSNLTSIDKVELKVFASTLIAPLVAAVPSFSDLVTPKIFATEEEGLNKAYKNKARILYDNGVKTYTLGGGYSSPKQNGSDKLVNEKDYLMFSNFSEFDLLTGAPDTAIDLNFGDCQTIVDSESTNTLFNLHWSSYYYELYHPDTRSYSIECMLNNNDISNFSFTDIIVIENSEFRVNNIQYSSEGLSKLELIKIN